MDSRSNFLKGLTIPLPNRSSTSIGLNESMLAFPVVSDSIDGTFSTGISKS